MPTTTNRMPLAMLDRDTLLAWYSKNRLFQAAWKDLSPVMKRQTARPIQKWVFAMGFLAGMQAARNEVEAVPDAVQIALDKVLAAFVARIEEKGKLRLIE